MADFEDLEGTIQNIIDQTDLKWVFVGGKGGVGKTTCSCSLAVQLTKHRRNVLIVSTDPAHNLSDAFDQKFCGEPTKVSGFDNLFAVEVDPSADAEKMKNAQQNDDTGMMAAMSKMASNMPGIDEAMSFQHMIKMVENDTFDIVVFDTAPTGHTLRLLAFPETFGGMLDTMFQGPMAGMMEKMQAMLGGGQGGQEENMQQLSQTMKAVGEKFRNPNWTTFVCVCIPEFLSLYETERLVQELTRMEIDVHNVIVNQLLFKTFNCEQCVSRSKIQHKYLEQIMELYEDFNVTTLPLVSKEVRGVDSLKTFSEKLLVEQRPESLA
eukprot:TRINITY_DN2530_c0_g1_i2.p1 TRINITY_DN2530_c0_g1~~TRINITY_DN2530_c0_g1_i2.p1  ORF type:complete len:322 (+),score=85.81 TRINITY_DN2530_c0_g1_i2:73-1038(+)